MFDKTKQFRDATEKENFADLLEMELKKGDTNGTYISHSTFFYIAVKSYVLTV